MTFPLLLLPAELRLQVYEHLSIPRSGPTSELQGLLLSCRQIKKELEGEYVKKMKALTEETIHGWPFAQIAPLHVSAPQRLADVSNIRIEMPASPFLVRKHNGDLVNDPAAHIRMVEPLLPLLKLHLSSLTLRYYDNKNDQHDSPTCRESLRLFGFFFNAFSYILHDPQLQMRFSRSLKIDRVVLDFGSAHKDVEDGALLMILGCWSLREVELKTVREVWLYSFKDEIGREVFQMGLDFEYGLKKAAEGARRFDPKTRKPLE